jgi:small subunit ribosomal protein S16
LVKIRLARTGSRKRPYYRIVAAEDSFRRDGRFLEILGTYDPLRKPAGIEVKSEAVLKWLSQGAQPSDTVKRILAKAGVWAHWRSVQNGSAELGGLTGRLTGEIERKRPPRPSKKAAARIAPAEEAGEGGESVAAATSKETSG